MLLKIYKFFREGIVWLSLLIIAFLTVNSLLWTSYFKWDESGQYLGEKIFYKSDNFVLTIICFAILFWILYQTKCFAKIKLSTLTCIFFIYVVLVSGIWVYLANPIPVADDMMVTSAAKDFMSGNYVQLQEGGYLNNFTHQLGVTLFIEILFRIFGKGGIVVFRVINVIALIGIYVILLKISKLLFKKEIVQRCCIILLGGFWVPLFYVTFVYGNTIGLALALAAVWLEIVYIRTRRIKTIVVSVLLAVLSTLIKSNYLIFIIAMILILVIDGLKERRKINVLICVAFLSANTLLSNIVLYQYEYRAGCELKGTSKLLWIAMGMSDETLYAEGWYNLSLGNMLNEIAKSEDSGAEIAIKSIKQSMNKFENDKLKACKFYYNKIVSQWNEPSFEALWVNYHQPEQHDGDQSAILNSIYRGALNKIINWEFNFWHFLILSLALVYVISQTICSKLKNMSIEHLFLLVIVIGGFFFHILWEAKSQYIWTYFILLIPYSAAGFDLLLVKVEKLKQKIVRR